MYNSKDLVTFTAKSLKVAYINKVKAKNTKPKSKSIFNFFLEQLSEPEMERILYKSENGQSFRKLKSRMVEDAIDLMVSQINKIKFRNSYDRDTFRIQKLLLISKLLIIKDQRKLARPMLKKALHIAEKIQDTNKIIQLSKLLSYDSVINNCYSEFKKYRNLLNSKLRQLNVELELETDYYEILNRIYERTECTAQTIFELRKLFEKAILAFSEYKSHALHLVYYRSGVRYYHSIHDFKAVIDHCQKAIAYLIANKNLIQNSRLGEFSLYEMESCLSLQDFQQGIQCANKCIRYFVPYSSSWLIFYEYYFLLAMRTFNYRKAVEIFDNINASEYKKNQMGELQLEKWKIYEAYLCYATGMYSGQKQFNLYKYINEIKLFRKDKNGYFYSVLISKFLLLLNMGKTDEILTIEEGFKLYIKRYINKNELPRHYIFGDFLFDLFKNNFMLNNLICNNYLEKLNAYSELEETEVIPYHHLVEMISTKLKMSA